VPEFGKRVIEPLPRHFLGVDEDRIDVEKQSLQRPHVSADYSKGDAEC